MRSIFPKAGWMLAGVLALYVLSALAGVVTGGPLDPPGAPAPTLKTLGDIAPSWHRVLSSSGADSCNTERFECVLGDTGVLDRETGLVWETSPSESAAFWTGAFDACLSRSLGDRAGWRLPAAEELLTLFESNLSLPAGHPFTAITAGEQFWTASTYAADPTHAVIKINGAGGATHVAKTSTNDVWCVRGGARGDGF